MTSFKKNPPADPTPPGEILVLGAGPAGLACAYELAQKNLPCKVIEKSSMVGGLCRTLEYRGNLFDIGGHRFLTHSSEINALWDKILSRDLLKVQRKSRILYRGKYFNYPLEPLNALFGLGIGESLLCFLSSIRSKFFSRQDESSFEGWMVKRFGRRLYEIFFKTYTEKVWGVPCSQLSSDWAVQRIQGLSLTKALLNILFKTSSRLKNKASLKTLSEEFLYPVRGPGLFCEKMKEASLSGGAQYLCETEAKEISWSGNRIDHVTIQKKDGHFEKLPVSHLCTSIPLTLFVQRMNPEPPQEVLSACQNLRFRSFMTVNLIFNKACVFPDNWIYVHSPGVVLGRIQNYKNWSPYMVTNSETTTLGAEYFVTEGDHLWNMKNETLIQFALRELDQLGIISPKYFVDGFVVRAANVYPVYGPSYQSSLAIIRSFLDGIRNLQVMGRSGMFRYNNSDHALLTGLYAARNVQGSRYDLWAIEPDHEHHEEFQSTEIY